MNFRQLKEMIDDFYAQVPESHDADLRINVGHSVMGINKVACYNLEKGRCTVRRVCRSTKGQRTSQPPWESTSARIVLFAARCGDSGYML